MTNNGPGLVPIYLWTHVMGGSINSYDYVLIKKKKKGK